MSSGFALKNGALLLSTEAPGGIYNADQLRKVAQISEDTSMIVKVTEDQRLAIVVSKDQVSKITQDLSEVGLEVRNYQEGLHQATSCLGKMCSAHEQDALKSAVQITEAMKGITTSTPLKIGLNGCSRCCNPTHTLDISIVGDASGYRIALGGKSAMIPEFGQFAAESVPADKLPLLMRSVVETYSKLGGSDGSMQELIERVGLGPFAKILAPWSQDAGIGEDFSSSSASDEELSGLSSQEDTLELPTDTSVVGDELSELDLQLDDQDLNFEENLELEKGAQETKEELRADLGNLDEISELESEDLENIELDMDGLEGAGGEGSNILATDNANAELEGLDDIDLSGFDDAKLDAEIATDMDIESNAPHSASGPKMTLDESEDVAIDMDGLESMESLDVPIHEMPELDLDEGMELRIDKTPDSSGDESLPDTIQAIEGELSDDEQDLESIVGDVAFEVEDAIEDSLGEVSELDQELEQLNSDFDEVALLEPEEKVISAPEPSVVQQVEVKNEDLSEFENIAGKEATEADVDELEKKLDSEVDEQLSFQHLSEDDNEANRLETLSLLEDDSLDNSLDNIDQEALSADDSDLLDRDSSALEDLSFQSDEQDVASSERHSSGILNETSTSIDSNVKPFKSSSSSKVSLQDMDISSSGGIYLRFSNGLELELGREIFDGTKKAMKFAGMTLKIDSTGGNRSVELDGLKFSVPSHAA